jgi:hypothetical protein
VQSSDVAALSLPNSLVTRDRQYLNAQFLKRRLPQQTAPQPTVDLLLRLQKTRGNKFARTFLESTRPGKPPSVSHSRISDPGAASKDAAATRAASSESLLLASAAEMPSPLHDRTESGAHGSSAVTVPPQVSTPVPSAENPFHAAGRPARDTAQEPAAPAAPISTRTAGQPLNARANDQMQQIKADSDRSEAEVVRTGSANRRRLADLFRGLRAHFSNFFAQSSSEVQRFIATKQAEFSTAAASVIRSAHALVANAATEAESSANSTRESIDHAVQSVADSLTSRVDGIKNQIVGVINRFPLPALPGAAQLRALVAGMVQRAASAVTEGLSRVRELISATLAAGMALLRNMLDVLHQLADAAISQAGAAVLRISQFAFQTLARVSTVIISALRRAFNATIFPMLNTLEGKIQAAITKSQQQAITAIRTNRDQHLQPSSPGSQSRGAASSAASGGAADGGAVQEARETNQDIVRIFAERSVTLIESIVQRINAGVTQIIDHITKGVTQATQLIAGKLQELTQSLSKIVEAVGNFIRSAVQALKDALGRVVDLVRTLIQNPVDQLVRFAESVVSRITDFVSRMVRNLINAITGSQPAQETGEFAPTRGFAPAPAFLAPPLPIVIAVLAGIIALLGGSVYLVGGTVIIIIGGTVIFISETAVIIIAVVLVILLLLLLIYILYRIWKKRKRKRPGRIISKTVQSSPSPRTRTTVGVGEEVRLRYTGGSTTWTASGGTLSAHTGASVLFTAPDTGMSVTITAGTASLVFTVLAPSGVFMDRHGAMKHTFNQPDSGIRMRPYLLPDTVNFYRVIYHEMDVPFVATPGVYSCNPGKGGHCGAGGGGVPCPDLSVSNTVVAGKGTRTVLDDCAYSGHCGTPPPYAPGTLLGSIPHEYKVGSGSFHPFAPVLQKHSLKADGVTLTTEKNGASGSTTVSSPTSSNGC